MAREEVFGERFGFGEMVKVGTGLVLIPSAGVHVVHQHVFVFPVQLEDARPLHGCLSCVSVYIPEVFLPFAFQAFRSGLLDAVFHFLAIFVLGVAFIEKVVSAIRSMMSLSMLAVFGRKECLGSFSKPVKSLLAYA